MHLVPTNFRMLLAQNHCDELLTVENTEDFNTQYIMRKKCLHRWANLTITVISCGQHLNCCV